MRSYVYLLIVLFSIATFLGCSSSEKNQLSQNEYSISFKIKNFKANSLFMYSCRGTRQMLVDSVSIAQDSATLLIPKETPPGIYRFVIDEAIVDLILTQENISVSLDAASTQNPIVIEESRENKWFYDFLYEYSSITSQDSTSCEEFNTIQTKYMADQAPEHAKKFINLILASNKCSDKVVCMTPLIINSPYTNSLLKVIASNRSQTNNASDVLNSILSCSDSSDQVLHEIYSAFWESGISANQPKMLNAILELEDAKFNNEYNRIKKDSEIKSIEAGSTFPSEHLIDNFTPGSMNLYYLIIHEEPDPAKCAEIVRVQNYLDKNKDKYFIIPSNLISDEMKREIGYIAGSVVYMIGKNEVLADKWIGKRDLLMLK
jgi:hypothetical protein